MTTKKLSPFIPDQLPEFVRTDYPDFVAFVKAYYEFLDSTKGTNYTARELASYKDIDETTDEFINYFLNDFLTSFPSETDLSLNKLVKLAREFYQTKGSYNSLNFLFRVLYKKDIQVFLPKENILRASDGKWYLPQAIKLTTANTPQSFDVSLLVKRVAKGNKSFATCVVEGAYRTFDADTGLEIIEIFVSNVKGSFINGETISIVYTKDPDVSILYTFTETIIGSLAGVIITPNTDPAIYHAHRGSGYQAGDPVVLIDGLSKKDPVVKKAVAVVNQVSTGGLQTAVVDRGGWGFRLFANSQVFVVNDPSDTTGTGALAYISSVDTSPGANVSVYINTDAISNYASLAINTAGYGFPNLISADESTTLADAFSYDLLTLAPITSVTIQNKGFKYTATPTLNAHSFYDTDISRPYYANGGMTPVNSSDVQNWANTRQTILDLGILAQVQVLKAGQNYDIGDPIYLDGIGDGFGANLSIGSLYAQNNGIETINIIDAGEGYRTPNVVVSSSNGSGALFAAYRLGEGANLTPTISGIGEIQNFTLQYPGLGYVSEPNVSMKIMDIYAANLIGNIVDNENVYQGPSVNHTFNGFVDYRPELSQNNTVRVYNWSGVLDTNQPLHFKNFDLDISNYKIYGKTTAIAEAVFLKGIVKYPGYYLNTDGFLSADQYLQDSKEYNNYSYIIVVQKALQEYRKVLLDLVHPVGMDMIGYYELLDSIEKRHDFDKIIFNNTANGSGTITPEFTITGGEGPYWTTPATISGSGGGWFVGGLRSDSTGWTWGDNYLGQLGTGNPGTELTPNGLRSTLSPVEPLGENSWKNLAIGDLHAIGIKTDGSLWGWGSNIQGQVGISYYTRYLSSPTSITNSFDWKQVTCGYRFSAAVKTDGTLWTWGDDNYGQLGNGSTTESRSSPGTTSDGGTNWSQVSAGYQFASAVKNDGTLWTWGNGYNGQLGLGFSPSSYPYIITDPTNIGGTDWANVSCGYLHSAAIKTDGTLWIWGNNQYGQLGNDSYYDTYSPITTIAGGTDWSEVSCGLRHTAAIKTDGTLWAWGDNSYGQLGTGYYISTSSPVMINSSVSWNNVSAFYYSTMATKTDGTLWRCGLDAGYFNQAMPIMIEYTFLPVKNSLYTAGNNAIWISSFSNFGGGALTNNNAMWLWGSNGNLSGQMGADSSLSYLGQYSPVQPVGTDSWAYLSVSLWRTAAIKTDGSLWLWGDAAYGSLGNNDGYTYGFGYGHSYSSPVEVSGGGNEWKQVNVNNNSYTAAIKNDGTLWTWGACGYGVLGHNDLQNCSSPVQISGGGNNWEQISTGGTFFMAAIKNDGTLWTWGQDYYGQLGINGSYDSSVSSPVQISGGGNDWAKVSSGYHHVGAIKTDGTLWMWGGNTYGQLGTGDNYGYSSPVMVSGGGTDWAKVSCGYDHTVAIKTDGTLWTWGWNTNGQLALGVSSSYYITPMLVPTSGPWVNASAGYGSTYATKSDGTIWFSGNPEIGSYEPVDVMQQLIFFPSSGGGSGSPTGINIAPIVDGTGTNFTTASVNDLLEIAFDNPEHLQVKVIKQIANDNQLIIESDTSFIGDGRLTVNNGSSIAYISEPNLRISANDYIAFNANGSIQYSEIVGFVGSQNNTIILSQNAPSDNTNVLYVVYPSLINVSYRIISTYSNTTYQTVNFLNNNMNLVSFINNFNQPVTFVNPVS